MHELPLEDEGYFNLFLINLETLAETLIVIE